MRYPARWAWASKLAKPEDVRDEHVRMAYLLNGPVCCTGVCESTCKSSPVCLNGLSKLSFPKPTDCEGSLEVKRGKAFHPTIRNGLKNYGSTCYLNAFLQLYFRFGKLRQAIYSLPSENDRTGVIRQLQSIFSQLQLSTSGVVDPGGLIEALRLCEEEQQDAPEFHCLFMNLLEARFREVGLSLVDDLLRGEYVYETRCLYCGFTSCRPSKFLELSLKVSSTSLVECIGDYLKEECLTGENQYACSRCHCKRDGIRRAFITRAPSLLCIQLLRFTYDPRTGQRKKQKAAVRLPDLLELAALPPVPTTSSAISNHRVACLAFKHGGSASRIYRLCGVLLHIGTQPTSGHYVAVVRDSLVQNKNAGTSDVLDSWTVCNDNSVCTVPSAQFELSKVNGSTKAMQTTVVGTQTPTTSPSQEPEVIDVTADNTKGSLNSLDIPVDQSKNQIQWHKSSNAYMIFYQAVDDCSLMEDIAVPDHLRKTVEDGNTARRQKLQDEEQSEVNRQISIQTLLSALRPPDPASEPLSTISLVPTLWLTSWLNNPDHPPPNLVFSKDGSCTGADWPSKSADISEKGAKPKSENAKHSTCFFELCPHGHVPVDLDVHTLRGVSTAGLLKMVGASGSPDPPAPHFSVDACSSAISSGHFQPCRTCVCLKVALFHLEDSIRELSRGMDQFLRAERNAPATIPTLFDKTVTHCSDIEPLFYWIGRRSLRQWRNLARAYVQALYSDTGVSASDGESPHTAFNSDALCPHGKLRAFSKNVRRLPAPLWRRLAALFPRASIPTFPVFPTINILPVAAAEAPSTSTSLCPECDTLQSQLIQRATFERSLLPQLLVHTTRGIDDLDSLNNYPRPVGKAGQQTPLFEEHSRSPQPLSESGQLTTGIIPNPLAEPQIPDTPSLDPNLIYLVPLSFLALWRRFLRNPSPENLPTHLPSGFEGQGVLCKHRLLSMPWSELITYTELYPLSSREWHILSKAYSAVYSNESDENCVLDGRINQCMVVNHAYHSLPPLSLTPSVNGEGGWELSPTDLGIVCKECHTQVMIQRNHFQRGRLLIRLVTGPDEVHDDVSEAQASEENHSETDRTSGDSDNAKISPDKPEVTYQEEAGPVSGRGVNTRNFMTTTEVNEVTETLSPNTKRQIPLHTALPTPKRRKKAGSSTAYVRRSTRQRVTSNDLVVHGSSDQRLQDVKVQILQILGVSPVDQHLYFKGTELLDHTKTLDELGVQNNSLLHLWTESQPWDRGAVESDCEIGRGESKSKPLNPKTLLSPRTTSGIPVELGFKGTRLLES
ncbi:unnamed protein product [Calicophoron daubneyi]|uniref:ubiquitinyl hydrolase 1 n=1 Tax=Calicophoron daubneyi TaxID=300641 RepID=A0AAV2TY52_CALDB